MAHVQLPKAGGKEEGGGSWWWGGVPPPLQPLLEDGRNLGVLHRLTGHVDPRDATTIILLLGLVVSLLWMTRDLWKLKRKRQQQTKMD